MLQNYQQKNKKSDIYIIYASLKQIFLILNIITIVISMVEMNLTVFIRKHKNKGIRNA